jgi:hypothetical protein
LQGYGGEDFIWLRQAHDPNLNIAIYLPMHYPSFDEEINGTTFTFVPIAAEQGPCTQYSIMTDDLIFRMTACKDIDGYQIEEKNALPESIVDLEDYLSNAILTKERQEDESNLP